jgi:hypothetical protein
MPAKKKRSRVVRGDPEVEAERRRMFIRSVVFGVLVLVLMTVALSVVLSTFSHTSGEGRVTIVANVSYTVKLMEVPSEHSESAQALLSQAAVRSLAGENELFLRRLRDGGIALCAGRFDSPDSPEARAVQSRFAEYTLGGERPFPDAQIWGYGSDDRE